MGGDVYNISCPDQKCFSGYAHTSRFNGRESGAGLGVPRSSCEIGGGSGYDDTRVINQDRQIGYFGEGADEQNNENNNEEAFDATIHCG